MKATKDLTKLHNSPERTKRQEMLDNISDDMTDCLFKALVDNSEVAFGRYDYRDGFIEVEFHRGKEPIVAVCHNDNEHSSKRLEEAVRSCLPSWDKVAAEFEDSIKEEQEFQDYLWRNCRNM